MFVYNKVWMNGLTGAEEMEGSLCKVNRAIAQLRSVSTKPLVSGRRRQVLQVPQATTSCEW